MLTTGLRREDTRQIAYITADVHSTALSQLGLHEDDKKINFYH